MSVRQVLMISTCLAIFGLALAAHSLQNAEESPSARCEDLAQADFSAIVDAPTQITEAKTVAGADGLPARCQVTGYVTPNVRIGLILPLNRWNEKFIEQGCGGNCGSLIWEACDDPVRRGYACVISDMGHSSTMADSLWAYNNLEAKIDYGYRATHVAAVAGKAIAAHFYVKPPDRSYYMGCSQGGRQGLVEAQRFPFDFDGIVAGAPPISIISGHWMHLLWRRQQFDDANGNLKLSRDEVKLVHEAALAACDADDGIRDGIIGNPLTCKFDPATLLCSSEKATQCLSADKVEVVKGVYSDKLSPAGIVLSRGELPGTELHWSNWHDNRVDDKFRYMSLWPDPGRDWQSSNIDFDHLIEHTGMVETLYDASNPDLRRFKAVGGKLIVYHGWADEGVAPANTVDYYETAERTMGGRAATESFFRLFMIPGMNHCWGGVGADSIDYLSYIEDWVEKGNAPSKLIGAHVKADDLQDRINRGDQTAQRELDRRQAFPLDQKFIEFTRPIYPYPAVAKYTGSGDSKDATNFAPR